MSAPAILPWRPSHRVLIRWLVTILVLAALLEFARGVHWGETWAAIRSASPIVLGVAAVVNLVSLVLKAVRWWVFLRASGVESLGLVLRATFAGAALNNLLVANAGEAGRVVLVSRASGVASEKVLATVALERLFEFAGYVVMLALAVSLLRLPPELHTFRVWAFVALALLIAVLAWLLKHPERAELPALQAGGFMRRVAAYGRGFMRALRDVSSARRFGAAMALSIGGWALQVMTYHLTARAAGFDLPVAGTISCILAVNLGFAVRATPGNVGVFQAIYALTAAAFGMDRDAAIGVGLLIQAQQILPVMVIGMLAAAGADRERSRPRFDKA